MNRPLTIAVSKGYLLNETLILLKKIGYEFDEQEIKDSRKLYTYDKLKKIKLLYIRPWDAPVFVEYGAADLGVCGKDVLLEKQDKVIELLDLKFGGCRLVLAGEKSKSPLKLHHQIRVATKYINSTEAYFRKLGIEAIILKMYGAVELAPMTGLADVICDLTATGKTLVANNLEIMDEVFSSTARLVANPVSFRFYYDQINDLVNKAKNILG